MGLGPALAQQLSAEAEEMLTSCLVGVVLVPRVMPWRYVFKEYVKALEMRGVGGYPCARQAGLHTAILSREQVVTYPQR